MVVENQRRWDGR